MRINLKICNTLLLVFVFGLMEVQWMLGNFGVNITIIKPIVVIYAILIIVINLINYIYGKKNISLQGVLILITIIYCMFVAQLNFIEMFKISQFDAMQNISIFILGVALFIVAIDNNFFKNMYDCKKQIFIFFILLSVSPMLVYVLKFHSLDFYNSFRYNMYTSNDIVYVVKYQAYGAKLSLISFFLVSLYKKKALWIHMLTVSALLTVSARAWLIAYIFAISIHYLYNKFMLNFNIKKILLIMTFLLCFFVLLKIDIDINSNNWFIQSLFSGVHDSSFSYRQKIMEYNNSIKYDNFIFGDYAYDMKSGRMGLATHNITIVWEYYGIIIFLLYVLNWLYMLYKLLILHCENYKKDFCLMSMFAYSLLICVAYGGIGYLNFFIFGAIITVIKQKK